MIDKDLQVAYKVLAERERELEQLKSQQFTPNWNNAPKNALSFELQQAWIDIHGCRVEFKTVYKEQRPKPTPQVEVGQVWNRRDLDGFSCVIIALNDNKLVVDIYECDDFAIFDLSDFIAEFERVS